jgi:hypothetical protein
MLAWRMAAAHEDGADRARVLHISPANNRAVHKVTAPKLRQFGNDAFEIFKGLLIHPENFISCSTEQVFGPILDTAQETPAAQAWADYLRSRYTFLART